MKLRTLLDRWERAVDAIAYASWSSLALWLYGLVWFICERGNIGWDGWLALITMEVGLSIRRWQGRSRK